MKAVFYSTIAALILAVSASPALAQRFVYRNTYVAPTLYPSVYGNPGIYNYSYSTAPYNYQSTVTGFYPNPYGYYNAYTTTTNVVRPVYSSPYYSIIWDPVNLTYRYVTGYNNTPNYGYYYPGY
jgi:hypothetical protein